ncbi:cytochrome P450 [Auriscalpium vulgare]|uniref:Cytochrome P450 n=1 Tax=Auriscalpium vulgare TaxID=40419 RepID=A0ACB8S8M2_9AGAM|nr:cytochrome P450 [Auriscalpium vulgare]
MATVLLIQLVTAGVAIILGKCLLDFFQIHVASPLRNVRGPPSTSWLRGHMGQLFHPQGWDFHLKELASYGTVVRLRGFLGEDVLYVTDPGALRSILMDHGDTFDEPPMIIERNKLLWGNGLLSSTGAIHRRQRRVLNAVFSPARLRDILPTFYSVVHRTEDSMTQLLHFGSVELDMLVWMSRTSLELIGQAGVGVSFDTLAETSPPNPYMVAAKQLIPLSFPLQGFMRLIPHLVKIGSPEFRGFLAGIAPHANIRKLKEIIYFLYETNSSVFRGRVKDLGRDDRSAEASDIISALIQERQNSPDADKLSDEELIAQMGTLIFAGHDTTSVALCRTLHVLALNLEQQERLREELLRAPRSAHGDEDLSYNQLSALPYLDAVCKETLRLYSPVTQLHRVPRQDAIVPLSRPVCGVNKTQIDRLTVKAGTLVVVGAASVNRDPEIWGSDADQWIPERWLRPLPASVADASLPGVYANQMTFMGGGRSCIGFKFAEAEMKVVLSILLSRFKFEPADEAIVWNMYNFATPSVRVAGPPSMPLKVTLLG